MPAHTFPPSQAGTHHHELAAKNVQRGLAAKVQELSATFRKKQRVYMESELFHDDRWPFSCRAGRGPRLTDSRLLRHTHIELQGHAIKNQDLLAASGVVSLKGSAGMSALDEDVEAATAVRHV